MQQKPKLSFGSFTDSTFLEKTPWIYQKDTIIFCLVIIIEALQG